jgi:cobalt-zinc-cadmium efflux system membrane fusion protein
VGSPFVSTKKSAIHSRQIIAGTLAFLAAGAALVAWFTRDRWLPQQNAAPAPPTAGSNANSPDHLHATAEQKSVQVSDAGLQNIGYQPTTVKLAPFERSITAPAIVVERPGKSQVHVTAPFTGILTKINILQGQAVAPRSELFEVRLTHEELVTAQQEYLKTAESLDVTDREIARLQSVGEGVIAGRLVLEQQYEKQKLEAALRAAEQALLLHGLTETQVTAILSTRKLLRSLNVLAPDQGADGEVFGDDHSYHVQDLPVSLGQQIEVGQELCVLADHCELYVEGRAFEDDAEQLRDAIRQGWTVAATLLSDDDQPQRIEGLKLLYLSDTIDPESRAFRFYLSLPNDVAFDQKGPEGRRYIEWRFKPGQRMELQIPVERWESQIVLPRDAVVEEGAERFVYRQNGKEFERVPVHVEFRDGNSAVVSKSGKLFPGDIIAGKGAYQMHLQMKNKAGSGVDAHAGHSH